MDSLFEEIVLAMYFAVLIFGGISVLSLIISSFFDDTKIGRFFGGVLQVSLVLLFTDAILILLTLGIGGLIMLFNS